MQCPVQTLLCDELSPSPGMEERSQCESGHQVKDEHARGSACMNGDGVIVQSLSCVQLFVTKWGRVGRSWVRPQKAVQV